MALTPDTAEGGFHRGQGHILVNTKTGNILSGNRHDLAFPLASVTKVFAAEAIRRESIRTGKKFNENQMTLFLSRSKNPLGAALAKQVFGSEEKAVQAMHTMAKEMGLKGFRFTNTTGMNDDGVGSYVRATDVAKFMHNIHKDPKSLEFFNKHANPKSHSHGHTMPYAFSEGGVDWAKTGTNARAGDVTGAVMFKGGADKKTPYALFMHTDNKSKRPGIIQGLIRKARFGPEPSIGKLDLGIDKPTRLVENTQKPISQKTDPAPSPKPSFIARWRVSAAHPAPQPSPDAATQKTPEQKPPTPTARWRLAANPANA